MNLSVNSLSYIHPDREVLFKNISLSVQEGHKASLVGSNGAGKSTLLRVIAGLAAQAEGAVNISGDSWYIPQHLGQFDELTIAEALGVARKLAALRAILAGDADERHFITLGDDWEIEERVAEALAHWRLQHVELSQPMHLLSGGEKTKVFLAGISMHSPDIVLLDEPSNHLDETSRELLYDLVKKSSKTFLIISHDKKLLNLADTTFEITPNGIAVFGGNYDFYREQKDMQLNALQSQLGEGEKALRQSRQKAQELAEQRQKQDARGSKQGQKKSLPRIVSGGLKRQAENTTAKLKEVHADKIGDAAEDVRSIRAQISEQLVLRIDIRKPVTQPGKVLVEARGLDFSYNNKQLWKSPLDFMIRSGDRIRITGDNGSGKSTLVGLITGRLQSVAGDLFRADFQYVFIDQEYSMVQNELSVLAQARLFNERHLDDGEVKTVLHHYQFPREMWDLPCSGLSGGEKMKLSLCCISLQNNAPDMLILDEPTNNLDVRSQEILTNAVKSFTGTTVLISHDRTFVEDVGITEMLSLG